MSPADQHSCKAAAVDDVMYCELCGFQWPAVEAAPPCRPITFKNLRDRMADECTRAEGSLSTVASLGHKGMPTDGGAEARRRLAELNAVQRLVERCAGDKVIKERLSGKEA